jgi:8-oxo-dGTP diphosphatase
METVFASADTIALTENHLKQLHRDLLVHSHKGERRSCRFDLDLSVNLDGVGGTRSQLPPAISRARPRHCADNVGAWFFCPTIHSMPADTIQRRTIGILQRPDGRVLLERRAAKKTRLTDWKLPGGKIDTDEDAREALIREMQEELGIRVNEVRPWITRTADYPQGRFMLSIFRITAWAEEPRPMEGQELSWQDPDNLRLDPVLPAHQRVLAAFNLPPIYAITQAGKLGMALFLERLRLALRHGVRLVQVREKGMSVDQLHAFAGTVVAMCRPFGAKVLINGDIELARAVGADGVHLQPEQYRKPHARPAGNLLWAAACHNREELLHAARLDADFAVLSPVLPTRSHPGAEVLGWQGFTEAIRDLPMPVYALGGMKKGLLDSARYHHAHGIAMLSGIW